MSEIAKKAAAKIDCLVLHYSDDVDNEIPEMSKIIDAAIAEAVAEKDATIGALITGNAELVEEIRRLRGES